MLVTKRSGEKEPLEIKKIHDVLSWAVNGDERLGKITGVSVSDIEMNARLNFFEGMSTKDIHESLIKSAASLITLDTPNYDQVASRLVFLSVRKEVFGSHHVPSLKEVVKKNIVLGVYTSELSVYSDEELDELDLAIDHTRDDLFRYAGAEQMRKSYLVQNRKTKKLYESFQHPFVVVPMVLFKGYPKKERLGLIKEFYNLVSEQYISLPTPIMAGCRTPVKQFSSCCVIKAGDSIESINAVGNAIVSYSALKAGIGLDVGRIRAEGQPVRNGDAVTTGLIPFIKKFNGDLKCTSQGAIRGASANINFPGWHLEFENLIELKNERGTEETRVRTVDYTVGINGFMYERLINEGVITLFSPDEVPDLYEAFYKDQVLFKELYERYENDVRIRKLAIPAKEYFAKLLNERFETGRIYVMHVDHYNSHTPFKAPIYSTNLCVEIALPTTDLHLDSTGLIALCTLGAVNLGKFKSTANSIDDAIITRIANSLVRALDSLLDYQEYPVAAAKRHSMLYRPLGIGVIGLAHYLTKNNIMWKDAQQPVELIMERVSYALIKASIDLAKEKGPILGKTKYADGIFPKDTAFIKPATTLDWDYLSTEVKRHGIRNATLMALMPSESSSKISNATNGIEPPRDLITVKGNKDSVVSQVVPDFASCNHMYETLWSVKPTDYLKVVSSLQKYVDQSISTNTSYKGDVSMSELLRDLLLAYKLGIKSLYYCNTNDGNDQDDCSSGACKI